MGNQRTEKTVFSRTSYIFEIVVTVLVAILLVFTPKVFGAWLTAEDGAITIIPVFNLDRWNEVLPFVLFGMTIALVNKCFKVIKGNYCMTVLWGTIAECVVSSAIAIKVLHNPNAWNSNFVEELKQYTGTDLAQIFSGMGIAWLSVENLKDVLVMIIVLACVLEMSITLYRTLKYANKR